MNMETSDVDRENNLELQFMQGTPPGPEAVVQQGVYVPSNSSIVNTYLHIWISGLFIVFAVSTLVIERNGGYSSEISAR